MPYRFGCFSFQSCADRAVLEHKGLLYECADSSWQLTPKAQPYLDARRKTELTHFASRMVPERGNDLVRLLYRLHPYYVIKSEILDRVFSDKAHQKAIRDACPAHSGQALFTIGYEGDSVDGRLERLIRHGVKLLCDVRRNPLSRKTGFSKGPLSSYCAKVGIEYRHLPELGIPGQRRQELNTLADYQALFADCRREDLPKAKPVIEELGTLLKQYDRIALTVAQRDAARGEPHQIARAARALHQAARSGSDVFGFHLFKAITTRGAGAPESVRLVPDEVQASRSIKGHAGA